MNRRLRFTLTLLASDLAGFVVAYNLMAALRGFATWDALFVWSLFIPIFFLVSCLALIDGYSPRTDFLSLDYLSQHLLALAAAALCTLIVTYIVFTGGLAIQTSRAAIALAYVTYAPIGLATRRLLAARRARVRQNYAIVFVGDRHAGEEFAAECAQHGLERPLLLAAAPAETPSPDRPDLANLLDRIENGSLLVEAVVLRESTAALPPDFPDRLMRLHFAGVPTYTLELYHEQTWRKIPLYRINPVWLFQDGFQIAREPIFDRLKRISDLALAAIGLTISLPLLLTAALAIKLSDNGPIFFRQTRIGRHRRPFTLYKLRTMRSDPAGTGPRYTALRDNRITRVGRLLRASRLDELPQLWNVLRGDMSMIGPRAEWDVLVADYEREIPCYHFRHLVRPGITGWAQVNHPYGSGLEDAKRKLEYDLYYIRHYSFRLDAAIVLKTIHVMLTAKGGR